MQGVRISFLCFLFLVLSLTSQALAGDIPSALLNSKSAYDLYISSGDSELTIIQDVEIVGYDQIGGIDFLVIRNYGFSLKDQPGYIRVSSVVAILPEHKLRTFPSPNKKIKL